MVAGGKFLSQKNTSCSGRMPLLTRRLISVFPLTGRTKKRMSHMKNVSCCRRNSGYKVLIPVT